MYIEDVASLDSDLILSEAVIMEVLAIESEFAREQKLQELQRQADKLGKGIKSKFNKLYRAAKADFDFVYKQDLGFDLDKQPNRTNFSLLNKEQQLVCGDWIADDAGVWIHTDKGKAIACYHPIFPTKILRNAETGQYKIELTFSVRGKVRTALVDKSVVATPTKIVNLANYSVQVTALNAPYLVTYLADLESLNPELICEYTSTSRLGWITDHDESGEAKTMFLPYDQDVIFDNEQNTNSLFNSIRSVGSKDKWYDFVREVRAKKQQELLINLAASYASVLVEPLGTLPFIVSLWGGTGIGKTVVLMLATSVWADPSEGQYMTDAKATNTAMEIRLNILNSLPMTLDDMAQVKNQYDGDFSELIYRWCAGKGRDRSNTNLGLNKLTSWRNCTITNGERSLVDESTQGGAVNRVIDIESDGTPLFSGKDGRRAANLFRKNFGHSGKDFIELIESMDLKEVVALNDEYFKKIQEEAQKQGCEKEDKQIMPMALILTADELIEKYLFKDGIRLDLPTCVAYLKDKGSVSEHKRAYDYLLDQIEINRFHFAATEISDFEANVPQWGFFLAESPQVAIIPTIFDKLLKDGGFQGRAFKGWARKQGFLECDANDRFTKKIRTSPKTTGRFIVLKMQSDEVEETPDDCPFT